MTILCLLQRAIKEFKQKNNIDPNHIWLSMADYESYMEEEFLVSFDQGTSLKPPSILGLPFSLGSYSGVGLFKPMERSKLRLL